MGEGVRFVVDRDLGTLQDLEHTESERADRRRRPGGGVDHAVKRGSQQCGTLGSGNHFLEVQVVDQVFDADVAAAFGLELNQVCVMIHSGSRGPGLPGVRRRAGGVPQRPGQVRHRPAGPPVGVRPGSIPEGKKYIAAMRAAANFGFSNRQLLMQQAREVFAACSAGPGKTWAWNLLYDVAHNIAKLEEHTVDGK